MPLGVHFGSLLAPPGGALGRLRGALGASWRARGSSRVLLGLPWGTLGRSWGALGVRGVYFVDFERAEPRTTSYRLHGVRILQKKGRSRQGHENKLQRSIGICRLRTTHPTH